MDIENYLKNIRTVYLEKKYSRAANQKGFSTDRKIVVIESDDWGSIRMNSKETYDIMKKLDPKTDSHPYFRYDGLASEQDLTNLFEVLGSYKDKNGHNPVITANCAVVNPDFEAIKKSDYHEYSYELFLDTLKKTRGCEKSFGLWHQGMQEKLFVPQLHCREHFNVNRWMRALQDGDEWVRLAFEHNMISTASCKNQANENSYMDSFNYDSVDETEQLNRILMDGARFFERIFGYNSESFIASCYIWGKELEQTMKNVGIKYLQGEPEQRIPSTAIGTEKMNKVRHYMGEENDLGQIYLVRNCNFEPSYNYHKDWVTIALNGVKIAFEEKKPAIICSHRLNYIGRIDEANRDRNLKSLQVLLREIVTRWPDVEFMTTPELGRLIQQETMR